MKQMKNAFERIKWDIEDRKYGYIRNRKYSTCEKYYEIEDSKFKNECCRKDNSRNGETKFKKKIKS